MKLVIFDLDGTLIDSAEDIARSVNEVRETMSLAPLSVDVVESYIGHGVQRLLERSFPGADRATLERALELYFPVYRRRLLDHTTPYPGVVPALESLERPGRTLAVLTNKPRRESVMILQGLSLDGFFTAVYGGDSFGRKKPDPVGVHRLQEETGATPEETLFVGDSAIDLETARNAAVRSCLVTYGIKSEPVGSIEPDYRVNDLRELGPIVGSLPGEAR